MSDEAARLNGSTDDAWHLDKKVPISLIGAILVQTFGFGLWAATLNARLDYLERVSPVVSAEISKLEAAREAAALSLNTVQNDVRSILELARSNNRRNNAQDAHPSP